MCELARALVNRGQSTLSSQDLQERCRKSYVASYRTNKELVISQMLSRELR